MPTTSAGIGKRYFTSGKHVSKYHSQVPEVLFQRLLPDKLVFAEEPLDLKSLRGHQEVVQAVDRHLDVAGVDEVQDRLLITIFID